MLMHTVSPRVAVINREFARRIFGSVAHAVGGYYKMRDGTRIQVVGVVEDGKYLSPTEDPTPAMFFPFCNRHRGKPTWWCARTAILRSSPEPCGTHCTIRSEGCRP